MYLLYSLIGIVVGLAMGITGIGAGILTITLLTFAGVNIKTAVAVCMVMQLLPQSIIGVYNYREHIDWPMAIVVTLASLVGIGIGSYIVAKEYISELTIYRIITVFLVVTSIVFLKKYMISPNQNVI